LTQLLNGFLNSHLKRFGETLSAGQIEEMSMSELVVTLKNLVGRRCPIAANGVCGFRNSKHDHRQHEMKPEASESISLEEAKNEIEAACQSFEGSGDATPPSANGHSS